MSDGFKWDDLGPEDIVVEQTLETAIYWNTKGHLVLRQRSFSADDEDEVIVIPHERVRPLIDRLQAMLRDRAPTAPPK